jgi:hypothetical protein
MRPLTRLMVVMAMVGALVGTLGTDYANAANKVSYWSKCSGTWVSRVSVVGHGRNLVISMTPTTAARVMPPPIRLLRRTYNQVWDEIWRCVRYPSGLYGWQGDSLYQQLSCHVAYGIGRFGGPTWDLETWRPSIGLGSAIALAAAHRCNWI